MIANKNGNFDFLPGLPFLSFASIAASGHEIRRAVFRNMPPAVQALDAIAAHLASEGRPLAALCAIEYRQYKSRQLTRAEFSEFNQGYVAGLARAGLLVDGQVPVARTNVVIDNGQDGDAVYAFSYTVPASGSGANPNFVYSAIPEVRFIDGREEVVNEGGTSAEALEQKMAFILGAAKRNLSVAGLDWRAVTEIQLYAEFDLHPVFRTLMLDQMKPAAWRGIHLHHSLPPIGPCMIEMDFRSVAANLLIG